MTSFWRSIDMDLAQVNILVVGRRRMGLSSVSLLSYPHGQLPSTTGGSWTDRKHAVDIPYSVW